MVTKTYITKISLRKPESVPEKPSKKVRGQRLSAGIYDDRFDLYNYYTDYFEYPRAEAEPQEVWVSSVPIANSLYVISIDEATRAAENLRRLGSTAIATTEAVRNVSNQLRVLQESMAILPDSIGDLQTEITNRSNATQYTTQEIIQQLLDEYGRRGEI